MSSASIESQLPRRTKQALLDVALGEGPEWNRGEIYEHRFESALENLRLTDVIDKWIKTDQYSDDDQKGIDYWLIKNGVRVPFSICGLIANLRARERIKKSEKLRRQNIAHVDIRVFDEGLKSVGELTREVKSLFIQQFNNRHSRMR